MEYQKITMEKQKRFCSEPEIFIIIGYLLISIQTCVLRKGLNIGLLLFMRGFETETQMTGLNPRNK